MLPLCSWKYVVCYVVPSYAAYALFRAVTLVAATLLTGGYARQRNIARYAAYAAFISHTPAVTTAATRSLIYLPSSACGEGQTALPVRHYLPALPAAGLIRHVHGVALPKTSTIARHADRVSRVRRRHRHSVLLRILRHHVRRTGRSSRSASLLVAARCLPPSV